MIMNNMCKVICFRFTCAHKVKLRRSRCGGTFHRVRRSGTSTACTAEPYIDIKLSIDCGPCQQEEWDRGWKAKLERAKHFLEKAAELKMPGVGDVEELVKELEDEYQVASWNIRTRFPPGDKGSVKKVEKGEKTRRTSQLAQEVRPEDVVSDEERSRSAEPEVTVDSFYWNSITYDSAGNINYDNPLYHVDSSWVDGFLSEGDYGVSAHSDIDFTSGWGDASEWGTDQDTIEREVENIRQEEKCSQGLFAWGPDATNQCSSATIGMVGLKTAEDDLRHRTEEIIREFWQAVEPIDVDDPVQSQRLISTTQETFGPLQLAPEPTHHSCTLANGAADTAPMSLSSNPNAQIVRAKKEEKCAGQQSNHFIITSANTLIRNTFRPVDQLLPSEKDNILCTNLEPLRPSDVSKFSDGRLQIARLEITEVENKRADPRHIPSPPSSRIGILEQF
jgi:hypothetical protein